jgi:hypothetical protein
VPGLVWLSIKNFEVCLWGLDCFLSKKWIELIKKRSYTCIDAYSMNRSFL